MDNKTPYVVISASGLEGNIYDSFAKLGIDIARGVIDDDSFMNTCLVTVMNRMIYDPNEVLVRQLIAYRDRIDENGNLDFRKVGNRFSATKLYGLTKGPDGDDWMDIDFQFSETISYVNGIPLLVLGTYIDPPPKDVPLITMPNLDQLFNSNLVPLRGPRFPEYVTAGLPKDQFAPNIGNLRLFERAMAFELLNLIHKFKEYIFLHIQNGVDLKLLYDGVGFAERFHKTQTFPPS